MCVNPLPRESVPPAALIDTSSAAPTGSFCPPEENRLEPEENPDAPKERYLPRGSRKTKFFGVAYGKNSETARHCEARYTLLARCSLFIPTLLNSCKP